MAYSDYSAHWSYKDLITYQDLNQLGENDKAHVHDGTVTAGIVSAVDITMAATNKLRFDGVGGTSYLSEVSNANLGINAMNVGIDATLKLYLDGNACGGTTYFSEVSDGNVGLNNANLGLGATTKLYLDGAACTGNTYIYEVSADVASIVAGGANNMEFRTASTWAIQGIRFGTDSTNNQLNNASAGAGTATLYIGNASITVSSDRRIKRGIVPTSMVALDAISKLQVKDFMWDDPSDKAINNKNSRGIWTGLIAQEVIDVVPYAVNAPRPEGKEIDHKSPDLWGMEYHNMVPLLVKAIQELQVEVAILKEEGVV